MTRKIPVENVSWEALCALDAEPADNRNVESHLIGDTQAEYLLSLLTPAQQEVAKFLVAGLPPIEVVRVKGTRRLAIHRMIKRMRATLTPLYRRRLKKV